MSATGLRRFARPAPAELAEPGNPPVERCEMCAVAIADRHGAARHGHVVALDDRSLRCVCRPCYLLFDRPDAGGGRFRAVPERYLTDPAHPLTDDDWDLLGIPVTTAFFFVNSDLDRVIACYPSPAGATECLLDLDEWARLARTHPLLPAPAADDDLRSRSGSLRHTDTREA